MSDYISRASDAELLDKSQQMIQKITGQPEIYGISETRITEFEALIENFDQSLTAHFIAQTEASSKTKKKDADRQMIEDDIRSLMRLAKAHLGKDKSQIAALGIPVRPDAGLTSATVPTGNVDTSRRLRHTIRFADATMPDRKRLPKDSVGCEIWVKVGGEPPSDVKQCVYLTLGVKTPYTVEYTGAEAGKTAHYLLRWKTREGVSALSETISATITG
jgi:hypothetical protein